MPVVNELLLEESPTNRIRYRSSVFALNIDSNMSLLFEVLSHKRVLHRFNIKLCALGAFGERELDED